MRQSLPLESGMQKDALRGHETIRLSSARGSGIQQSLQSVAIELREVQEFDAELAMIRPPNRRGLDCNRRPYFHGPY